MKKCHHIIPGPVQSGPGQDRPITDNEWAWIEFIRLISNGTDPAPTLKRVQNLRMMMINREYPDPE